MSFYNSKRRSLILMGGRNGGGGGVGNNMATATVEDYNMINGGGGSCGSTSSSGSNASSSGNPANNAATTSPSPAYSLQQLARSRSFGGVFGGSPGTGGAGVARNNKGSFYHNNFSSNSFVLHGNNSRTGTWSSQHSPGLGVLGQGYGSPGGGVSRKLMNSLGTLTHSNNSTNTAPLGSSYSGTTGSSGGGVGNVGVPHNKSFGSILGGSSGLLGTNSQSMRTLPTSASGQNTIKTPRPNKTRIAIESLVRGLQDCIKQIEDEMCQIRSSIQDLTSIGENQSQGKLYELEKYSKSSERHLKRIEYQLSVVEELGEQYALQQKLREGVRTMAFAFSVSQGPEKETALANVKAGFRECTEMLCTLEGQLEMLLGTFHMEMKGIQGFARLCPGDVFEITIKHGLQKWKTRGKVGKDGSQVWDLPLATFHAVLGEVMHIKAAEVKTLGKQILLGNKFCEISELFSSHAQLMTINLNPSGSLKLNIIVAWNPLDSIEDHRNSPNGSVRMHSQNLIGSPSRKRRLSPTEINFRHSMSSISPENTISYSSSGSTKNSKSILDSPALTAAIEEHNSSDINKPNNQNPSSRHSALWERSLDSIEVVGANGSKVTVNGPGTLDTTESSKSERTNSFRFSSSTTPSKTARTCSPEVAILTKSDSKPMQNDSTTSATIHAEGLRNHSDENNVVMAANDEPRKSSSKILIETEQSPYKHDPNVHRISIGSNDSSSSSLTSDPSGNFTFVKKRSGGSFTDNHNGGQTSQIEFETNIALEELDMAIIDGDNSNHITTIEESMEAFCSYDRGGEDDEGNYDDHMPGSRKSNPSNVGLYTLRNSVLRLGSLLEDIQGQYPELEPLEMHLTTLERMIQNPCFLSSSSSSLNIESALECFDFLDTEEQQPQSPLGNNNNVISSTTTSTSTCDLAQSNNVVEDSSNVTTSPGVYIFGTSSRYSHHRHQSNDMLDPKMTARTTDSGISSLGHHSRSPSPNNSRNSSPVHTVTGSSQLDMALGAHIHMCLQLIHNVGSFGPLKHREKEAVSKLQQQGIIIGSIIGRTKSHDSLISNGLLELASLPQLQVLWERITDTGAPLCTSADVAVFGLEYDIKAIIQCKYAQEYSQQPSLARKVSQLLVQQMLDTGNETVLDRGQILTVFQFQNFLRPHEHSFHKLIDDLTEEEILQANLQHNQVSEIRGLPLTVPPKNVLFALIRLLLHENPEVTNLVKNYFNAISIATDKKRQIIETSLEMLEFPAHTDRKAACLVFGELKSFWRIKSYVVEPLLYIIQSDRNLEVRSVAKETILQILGDQDGDRVLQQVALSTHGFQGLGIN